MTTKELPCSHCGQDIHIPARYNATSIAALEAKLSKMEEARALIHKYPFHSADCRCKQWGGKIDPENCGQCQAREALTGGEEA